MQSIIEKLIPIHRRFQYTKEGLIIEFRLSGFEDKSQRYQFLWFYLYDIPVQYSVRYVNTTDKGANATVGVQGGETKRTWRFLA